MADKTSIEWTRGPDGSPGSTWNPITGCTLVSEGCRHCYAARLAATRMKHLPSRAGLARINAAGVAKFTGEVRFNGEWLAEPLRWTRPRRIFVCAHADLFAEAVPDAWIDRVFAVMAMAQGHTFQVLTKRPERMRCYVNRTGMRDDPGSWLAAVITGSSEIVGRSRRMVGRAADLIHGTPWPLPNVWLGTSVEDQATADARIPPLLDTPAAIRFLSAEPLLGPVDLTRIRFRNERGGQEDWDALDEDRHCAQCGGIVLPDGPCCDAECKGLRVVTSPRLDWVIAGGESDPSRGPRARPMHPDWPRALRDQCQAAGVPFFFKQWGDWANVSATQIDPALAAGKPYVHVEPHDRQRSGRSSAPNLQLSRVGKSRAGRLLDGREWNGMPGQERAE